MLVPQTAEYALRAMACLAIVDEGRRLTAKELSQQTSVPSHYLSKILRKLVTSGLVHAQKGPGGGVALGKTPEEIRFIDVFNALDFHPTKRGCAFGKGLCDESNPCPLHNAWSKLDRDFFRWAEKTTLLDVRENPGRGLVSIGS